MNNYFCCCDSCGSLDWIDSEFEDDGMNSINAKGNLLIQKDYDRFLFKYGFPLCSVCEKGLKLISFRDVNINMRKKIFKMMEDERMKWADSYWMFKALEEEE